MKKVVILFILAFVGFYGNSFANSDCSVEDNSFINENIDSSVNKKVIEESVKSFIRKNNSNVNRNEIYKSRINDIISNIQLLESGSKSARGHNWKNKKDTALFEAQLLYKELQKVCNIKVDIKKTTGTGYIKVKNNNLNYKKSSNNRKNFIINKITNKYNYFNIDYTYGQNNNKILFYYYDLSTKKRYGFYAKGGNVRLGANYKYKIKPGHKYLYFFYDRNIRKVLKKGSFITKKLICPEYKIPQIIDNNCKIVNLKDSKGCIKPILKCEEKKEFKLGSIINKYKYIKIGYTYTGSGEVLFKYGSGNEQYNFTNKGGSIELGDNYKYKVIPGKKYTYYFYDAKTKKYLGIKGTFIAKNTEQVKCGELNNQKLEKLPTYNTKGLCENGRVFNINTDYPAYYWSCIGKNQKKVFCKALMKKVCTKEYKPVCAEKIEKCTTISCSKVKKTYSNKCMSEIQGAKFLYEGKCGEPKKEFKLGKIVNEYRKFQLNYNYGDNNEEIIFEYNFNIPYIIKYRCGSFFHRRTCSKTEYKNISYKFTNKGGVINLGDKYKYKVIPGRKYNYIIKNKLGKILIKGNFIAKNIDKVKTNIENTKTFIYPKKDGLNIYYNTVSLTKFCNEQGYKYMISSKKRVTGFFGNGRLVKSFYKNKWIRIYRNIYTYNVTCSKTPKKNIIIKPICPVFNITAPKDPDCKIITIKNSNGCSVPKTVCKSPKTFIYPKKDGLNIYYNTVSLTKFCNEQGYKYMISSKKRVTGFFGNGRLVKSFYKNKWIRIYRNIYTYNVTCSNNKNSKKNKNSIFRGFFH